MKKFVPMIVLVASVMNITYAQSSPTDAKSVAPGVSAEEKSKIEKDIEDKLNRIAFVPGADFSTWTQNVDSVRSKLDAAQTPSQVAGAFNEALLKFGYSHLVVMTPEDGSNRRKGTRVGVGVQLEVKPDGLHIKGVLTDSPANKAGLLAGEIIILIDGKFPTGTSGLSGEKGSKVEIVVLGEDGKKRNVTITRDSFNTNPPAELKMERYGEVAIFKLPTFDQGYNSQNVIKLLDEAKNAKLLVVDLRNNPGGFVYNLLHFTGLVLPGQPAIGTMINKNLAQRFVKETGKDPKDLKALVDWSVDNLKPMKFNRTSFPKRIAVLTNGGTGSAAEITAAALRDVGGAKVFGSNSAGMVLAAIVATLPGDYTMYIPIQDYVTVNGLRLEGNGVIPDFAIPHSAPAPTFAQDDTIQKVLNWYDMTPNR